MSSFTAGFAARHESVARALQQAFETPPEGFAPADLKARAVGRGGQATGSGPVSFSPQADKPKHFEPAEPGTNPTEGWDPFAAAGNATPFADPIASAHAAGYAEGVAAATTEISEAAARDQLMLAQLAQALRTDDRLDRQRIARQLRQTVLFLVTRLVGEVGIEPDILSKRIESATDMLADSAESAMLRVHPEDIALLEGKLPKTIFAVGDASVGRGSFVLESASTIIEDGPELWLEQLAQAIDQVAVPRA